MCASHCNPSSLTPFHSKSHFSPHFPLSSFPHTLYWLAKGLCIDCMYIFFRFILYAERIWTYWAFGLLRIFQRERGGGGGGGAVLAERLENRQSGGGQSTGIDILSVRGSVQGRFWGTAVYLREGMLEKFNGGQDLTKRKKKKVQNT